MIITVLVSPCVIGALIAGDVVSEEENFVTDADVVLSDDDMPCFATVAVEV